MLPVPIIMFETEGLEARRSMEVGPVSKGLGGFSKHYPAADSSLNSHLTHEGGPREPTDTRYSSTALSDCSLWLSCLAGVGLVSCSEKPAVFFGEAWLGLPGLLVDLLFVWRVGFSLIV